MLTVVLRTVMLYICVTIGVRLMGKRQIGEMQPNELVVTLLISELAAIPLQDSSQPVLFGVLAVFTLVFLEICLSVLSMKCKSVRKMMSGKSVVVINNGAIDEAAMKNVRMTVLDLIELLRGQGVFDISTVAFAVLEVNGSLSVMLKSDCNPATCEDLGIKKKEECLSLPVICDGRIIGDSLKALKIEKSEMEKYLRPQKLSVKQVFLMMLDRFGNFTLVKKE